MKKLKTVEQIYRLAFNRKSIVVKNFKKPIPAAFLINWSGFMLVNWLKIGQFSEYKPKKI